MAQFEGLTSTCKKAILAPVGADTAGYKLLYKLPPSTMGSASSVHEDPAPVRAKTIASGIYARMVIPDNRLSSWLLVGTNLDTEARTFSSAPQSSLWRTGTERNCRSLCDNSNVCWGFIFNGVSQCLFRGGLDALNTRSFLVLPSSVDLSRFNWQGATALESAIGATLVLASQRNVTVVRSQVEAALSAIFVQTGVYDPVAALQRILGAPSPTPQPGQDSLQAAIDLVVALGVQQGVGVTQNQASDALNAVGFPWRPQAALDLILQQLGQGTLAAAVAAVQAAAAAQPNGATCRLHVPTWVTAVAALLPSSPDAPRTYAVTAALKLLAKAHDAAPEVQDLVDKDKKLPGITTQHIVDALLAVEGVSARDAFKRLEQQRQGTVTALDTALKNGVLVSIQQVADAVNITFKESASGKDAAELALGFISSKSVVLAQLPREAPVLTSDQVHAVLTSVHLDYRAFDVGIVVKRVSSLLEAMAALIPQTNAQGFELSEHQAVNLLLLAFAYRRQYSLEWALSVVPLLAENTKALLEVASIQASRSEATDHLLAVYGQTGSLDVTEAVRQLQLLQAFAAEVLKEKKNEFTAAEVRAGAVALYMRYGYDVAQVNDCLAYMRLAKKLSE
jgi:hypothetical protein